MKKYLAALLMGAFVFTASVATIGCGDDKPKADKKEEKKAAEKKAEEKKADK